MAKEERQYYTVNYHVYHDDWKKYISLKSEIEDAIGNSSVKQISTETIKAFFDIQNKVIRNKKAYLDSVKSTLLTFTNAPSFTFKLETSRQIPASGFNDEYTMEDVFSFAGFIDYFFSMFRWEGDNGIGGTEQAEPLTKELIIHQAYWLINHYLEEIDPNSKSITQYKRLSIVGLVTAQFGFLSSEAEHTSSSRMYGGYTEYLYSSVKYIKKKKA